MKILIVEDERAIADVERAYMEREGYSAVIASDGIQALEVFRRDTFDLVLLDIMLPGLQGDDVCREIRKISSVPILMVTAKSAEDDVIAGLDAGADDYIVKPFSPRVLMARIRANLRKFDAPGDEPKQIITVGSVLEIDPNSVMVRKNGEEIPMTRNEFLILSTMAARPEKTWSRDDLITYALGYEYDGFERSIDSYIKNIRKKLADDVHENG
ncbi:response regulator transcription factor, partial [Synergistaceae bacterium OttesenSCG-928-D05]|nr:response regulator transcription factor [Synergistaceae bacterium OttesenSCG-928-D05]